jgi:hypothetical protein
VKITNFIISCFCEHPAPCGDWEEAPHQNFQNFKKVSCAWEGWLLPTETPRKIEGVEGTPRNANHLNQNTHGTSI